MTLGERIKKIRVSKGLKQREVAARMQSSEGYLSRLEKDKVPNPGKDIIERLAYSLGVTVSEIHGEESRKTRMVPLLDWIQAGEFNGASPTPYPGSAAEYVEAELTSPQIFALRVKDDGMEPRFREGDILYLDSGLEPQPGDYVVAKIDEEGEATFRQLRRMGTMTYLHALNEKYLDIPLRKGIRIIGKVVEVKIKL